MSTLPGLVIDDVRVVEVGTGEVRPPGTVRVRDGLITEIGSGSGAGAEEAGSEVVDGRGRFLVPGFNDLHAHPLGTPQAAGALELMLTFGVTGFRQMDGSPELLARRAAGTLLPAVSPALLAMPGSLLTPLNAGNDRTVTDTVRAQAEQGADFVKLGFVGEAVYPAAQAEANRVGIPLGGHLPATVDAARAARSGLRFVEHLGPGVALLLSCCDDADALRNELRDELRGRDGRRPASLPRFSSPAGRRLLTPLAERIFGLLLRRVVLNPSLRTSPDRVESMSRVLDGFREERARELAAVLVEQQTWQCPTLIRERTNERGDDPELIADPELRFVSDRTLRRWRQVATRFAALPERTRQVLSRLFAQQLELTRIFAEEGVPLLAGSDVCGSSWEVPGAALHREFDLLATAGLSPLRILQLTTCEPARFLGRDDFGAVEPGRRADLVLLGADPTTSVESLHQVAGVVRAGRWFPAAELAARQQRLMVERTAA